MTVREIRADELNALLELYLHLHETEIPENTEYLERTWQTITEDRNHHIFVAEENGQLVSSCVCVVIPNLTREVRPYAFIENVVTHKAYRNRGFATAVLQKAKQTAEDSNCYKMMLLTGAKDAETLRFYQKAGYNCGDKTAFIQWL